VTSVQLKPSEPRTEPSGHTPLTAIVLARNEERDLGRCLKALQWVDQLLVVDDHSTDGTEDVARWHGAEVVRHRLKRFDEQRNFALGLARHEWVLFVDADEVVPPELAQEIRAVLAAPGASVYALRRRNWFLGRPMRHGSWKNDIQPKLGRADAGRWQNAVHETWHFTEEPVVLSAPLEHIGDLSYAERLLKSNRYSTLMAERLYAAGTSPGHLRMLARPLWRCLKNYVLRQGFRDGRRGLIWTVHVFLAEFAIEVKLWELATADERGESAAEF
jgi:glycosyltransferase involved in cell wall biosynthesis